MNIWLTIPFIIFVGVALLKALERRAVFKQPRIEKRILFIRERRSLWKIIGYMILAGCIFFAIQPDVMTVSMAFFKLSLVCSIFFLDSIMKTKLYITDKRIYVIERFRNKSFVFAKELSTEDIYNVEASRHYPGVYNLYYFGKKNAANCLTLHISKEEEREMFKFIMKQRMNINILHEIKDERINEFKRNTQGVDLFSKVFIWLAFITIITAVIRATKEPNYYLSESEAVVSYIFTSLFIPLALYFFSYFFILTSGIVKKLNTISVKMVAFYLMLASSSIPFYQLLKNGSQTKEEFLRSQLSGMLVFSIIIFAGFLFGMVVKAVQEGKRRRVEMQQRAVMRRAKG